MTDHDVARRRYRQLQDRARSQGRPTWELLEMYALEGFLARLAASRYRSDLILKGGMLLAAFGTRRPTRDVDVQAQQLTNDVAVVRGVIAEVAALEPSGPDGLEFDTTDVQGELIREEDIDSGVRVSLAANLATAQMKVKVDVSIGDPVWPAPTDIELPRILDDDRPIALRGYPMPMVLAEKTVTALQRGTANTRWRDLADVYLLSRQHQVGGRELQQSLRVVAAHRRVELAPLSGVLVGYAELAQDRWSRWRAANLAAHVPQRFSELLGHIYGFVDPALMLQVEDATWDPVEFTWQLG